MMFTLLLISYNLNSIIKMIQIMLHNKGIREERKQQYLILYAYIHTNIHDKVEEILMTIIVLIFLSAHVVVHSIYNYMFVLPSLISICLQQVP